MFCVLDDFFRVSKKTVLGYSWSTLLWFWHYSPHRSRDALSPICGNLVFFVFGTFCVRKTFEQKYWSHKKKKKLLECLLLLRIDNKLTLHWPILIIPSQLLSINARKQSFSWGTSNFVIVSIPWYGLQISWMVILTKETPHLIILGSHVFVKSCAHNSIRSCHKTKFLCLKLVKIWKFETLWNSF